MTLIMPLLVKLSGMLLPLQNERHSNCCNDLELDSCNQRFYPNDGRIARHILCIGSADIVTLFTVLVMIDNESSPIPVI